MTDKSMIQLYLKDADEAITDIDSNLDSIDKDSLSIGANIESTKEDDETKKKIEETLLLCIQNIRNLTMICWMAGKDEKDEELDFLTQLVDNHDLFFTRIFNYITRTTAKRELIVEFLKLFEIMIRDNKNILIRFMGKEKKLADKLKNLLNQSIHEDKDQIIRRWILKIIYIYQINKEKIPDFVTLDYVSKRRDYIKDYPDKDTDD